MRVLLGGGEGDPPTPSLKSMPAGGEALNQSKKGGDPTPPPSDP